MQNRRWWDVAAIAVALVVAAISAMAPPFGASDWGDWACVAAFLAFYFAYARWRITSPPSPHDTVAVVGFAVILAVGVAFEPSFAILQTFLYPFAWSIATNTRGAVFANLLIGSAVVIGYTARYGMAGLANGIAIAALSVVFSLALGLWITRIAEYGEERAQLLAELQAAQGELAALSRESGVASERERLAREIHDTIAQSLTGLVMVAQRARGEVAALEGSEKAVESVEMIEALAREALTEARVARRIDGGDAGRARASPRRSTASPSASSARPACRSRTARRRRRPRPRARGGAAALRPGGSRERAQARPRGHGIALASERGR